MLKQLFDKSAVAKVLSTEDVWKWNLWTTEEERDSSIEHLAESIYEKNFSISPFIKKIKRDKPTYQVSNIQDQISIRLLDRYIRRIYKVRQSDRQKIVGQLKTVLKDSGDYTAMRLDIANCYESMNFERLILKLDNDMILAPVCVQLLESILSRCQESQISGLPRGLSISPTLAEICLKPIDKFIKSQEGVIYSTRYVDDFFILVDKTSAHRLKSNLELRLSQLGLRLNQDHHKRYIGDSRSSEFDYLGYAFEVNFQKGKENSVKVTISSKKIDKIKTKIAISFNEYIKSPNISLLKQRLNYLSTLKVIKSNENGCLLGGIAFNYKHVSDNFNSLKAVDGFFKKIVDDNRYSLNPTDKSLLLKTSFHNSVINNKVSK
jgi:hypothetical protein